MPIFNSIPQPTVSVEPSVLPEPGSPLQEVIVEAGRSERHYWREIWRYRDLLYFLAWRDITVRYKQTFVGIAWALIQPAFTLFVFTIFGRLAKLPTSGEPRAIMVFAAVLPWQFFSSALNAAGTSLTANSSLISKVYFPRLLIPASSVVTALFDFAISMGLYVVLSIAYRSPPSWNFVALPGFVLLAMVVALGAGLWITALNVKYRDFRIVLPFILQLGLYISPVAYPTSIVPERFLWLFRMNPMVGVIDGFRWCLLRDSGPFDASGLLVSCVAAVFLFSTGLMYFRHTERRFADFI